MGLLNSLKKKKKNSSEEVPETYFVHGFNSLVMYFCKCVGLLGVFISWENKSHI